MPGPDVVRGPANRVEMAHRTTSSGRRSALAAPCRSPGCRAAGVRPNRPFRVPSQITDRAGALTGNDQADVQTALDQLSSEDNVNLYVVYVDTFDDPSDGQRLGGADLRSCPTWGSNQMLLAIATGGRAYAVQRAEQLRAQRQPAGPDRDHADPAAAARRRLGRRGHRRGQRLPGRARRLVLDLVVGRRRASSSSAAGGYLIYRRTGARPRTEQPAGRSRSAPDGQPLPNRRSRWISCPPAACRP